MPSQPRRKEDENANRNFGAVTVEVRAQTVNEDERSIEATLSTEQPIAMYDWERNMVVPEILLADGLAMPKSRQVPLLNSHNRYSIADQLGSIRGISVDGNQVSGRLFFSKTADNEWQKVREGHITDVSVGYSVIKRQFVPEGQTKRINGRDFIGPANVVTKWRLLEGSVTPIGADDMAKMRGYTGHAISTEESFMDQELRALLVSRGMPENATEQEANKWLVRHFNEAGAEKKEEKREQVTIPAEVVASAVRAALESEKAERRAYRQEVDTLLDVAGMPELASRAYAFEDIADVRKLIKDERAKGASGDTKIVPTEAQRDKQSGAIHTALVMRALNNVAAKQESIDELFPKEKRSAEASHYRNASLFDMARDYVEMGGVNTRGLSREQVAMAAFGFHRQAGVRAEAGYHQTSSFANITLDAVNKSMQVGYQEFPATWRGPMRQGASVSDFKAIHRLRLGSIANLPVWPGIDAPEKASFTDAKESYAVECRSSTISFGYKLLVNDDMDALTRVPQMYGTAASRTVNAAAWSQVTSNPTLSDSVALFATATGARKRTNLTSGAGAPSVSTLQTLTNLMMQMRGENTPEGNESEDILNLQPKYLIVPSALSTTAKQLVLSVYDPSSANMAYNTANGLTPVIEPLLDANSTTAWYLFASPAQIDTVEVTFLQGQESPVVRDWMDDETLSQNFAVLQTFGVKALNHRGVQKHAGA